jgi:tetratricopeptide (TPR) repeat protein
VAVASRLWNALEMPVLHGYDAIGHVAYALFLDLYRAVPHADQGWSYFQPPLHYLFGWGLAQAGSAPVLVRGLALVASTASLLTAALAAYAVRLGMPGRPGAPLIAFVAVAFLPVHIYSSTMPGNELTSALLGSAAVLLFLRNERRESPSLVGDAGTGLMAGLALLAKFSGLLPLVVILAALGLGSLRRSGADPVRTTLRAALIAGVALVVCVPYYLRNVGEFGTPFQLSRDFPLVAAVESQQPPGERSWRDLVRFPLRAFAEPDPRAEHLLHSVPGGVYVHAWTDARLGVERPLARALMIAGLVPTGLALLGLALCVRRALRERDPVEGALAMLGLAAAGALLIMAYRVPTFAMLKASYLLGASVSYGYFVARGIAFLNRPAGAGASAFVVAAAVLSAIASTPGGLRPRGGENEWMASVHAYFGAYDEAQAIYRRQKDVVRLKRRARMGGQRALGRTLMREYRAGVLIEAGEAAHAREIYDGRRRVVGAPPHLESVSSRWGMNRQAVATALAGDLPAARDLLNRALDRATEPPLLVNRAALRALQGDHGGAEDDLRRALEGEPGLSAAWSVRAFLEAQRGETEEAARSRREAERLSYLAPRGFPYGVGNGFHLNGQRFMLVIDDGELALYRPGRARGGR